MYVSHLSTNRQAHHRNLLGLSFEGRASFRWPLFFPLRFVLPFCWGRCTPSSLPLNPPCPLFGAIKASGAFRRQIVVAQRGGRAASFLCNPLDLSYIPSRENASARGYGKGFEIGHLVLKPAALLREMAFFKRSPARTISLLTSSQDEYGIGDFLLCASCGGSRSFGDCWLIFSVEDPLTIA